jgi:phage-related protein
VREFRYYVAPGGGKVVEKEIAKAKLTAEEAATIEVVIDRMECGERLPGDVKHLRGDIWELIIPGTRRTFRLLWAEEGEANVLLGLVFFSKKSRKTPPEYIDLAEERLKKHLG